MNDRDDRGRDGEFTGNRREQASRRTSYAAERTGLASERTFGAWMRTGLAGMAVAMAVERLLPTESRWLAQTTATVALLFSMGCYGIGWYRYRDDVKVHRRVRGPFLSVMAATLLAGLGIVANIGAALLIWGPRALP